MCLVWSFIKLEHYVSIHYHPMSKYVEYSKKLNVMLHLVHIVKMQKQSQAKPSSGENLLVFLV